LMAGDVDGFPDFPAPEMIAQLARDPRFLVHEGSTEGETILAMNNARPALRDVRVRRAIAHAIDRQALIDGAMFGFGTPIGSHFPPHHSAYLDLTGASVFNPQKSKALLADAGFASGLTLTLRLPPPMYARRGGEIIAAQLRAVGIKTQIQTMEWAQWLDQVLTRKSYDLTIVSHTEPMDISIYARDDYYFNSVDPEMKRLIAQLEQTQSLPARTAVLHKAQRRLATTMVNAYLFQLPKLGVWRASVRGQWRSSPIQANDMTKVWIAP
jgi:peptide/nickel transport system substrate-binding protein